MLKKLIRWALRVFRSQDMVRTVTWCHPDWDMGLTLDLDGDVRPESYLSKDSDASKLYVQEVRDMTRGEFEALEEFAG